MTFNFNDYVSLAVMLLMTVALIAGQVEANADLAEPQAVHIPISIDNGKADIEFGTYLSEQALRISIDIAADLPLFRGEDE